MKNGVPDPSPPFRLTDYPMHYFAAIQRQNLVNMERALAPIGLSPMEWRVLAILGESGGKTIGEIATVAVADRSKASRTVNDMVQKGLLARKTSEVDSRKTPFHLTTNGRAKLNEALAVANRIYARNLHGVSDQELATLMTLLRKIKDNVFRTESYFFG